MKTMFSNSNNEAARQIKPIFTVVDSILTDCRPKRMMINCRSLTIDRQSGWCVELVNSISHGAGILSDVVVWKPLYCQTPPFIGKHILLAIVLDCHLIVRPANCRFWYSAGVTFKVCCLIFVVSHICQIPCNHHWDCMCKKGTDRTAEFPCITINERNVWTWSFNKT